MELILVRHPETQANRDKVFYTESDYPYTCRGQIELSNIVKELKDLDYPVYSSPFSRALKVAAMISNTVIVDDRLKEIDFGKLKGLSISEIAEQYPEDYRHLKDKVHSYTFPDGEPYETFFGRISEFFDEVVHRGENAIVCTHGGVINLAIKRYFNLDQCYPKTGAIIKLKLDLEDPEE